jgi:ABC-type multidrug transport system fused ATPase/permease subunit
LVSWYIDCLVNNCFLILYKHENNFSVIAAGLRGFIFSITSTNLIQRLRNIVFTSVVKQDMEFFDQTKTGEITSRLSSDITTVGEAISINLNIFLRSVVQASKYLLINKWI